MKETDLLWAAAAFIQADAEYVELLARTVGLGVEEEERHPVTQVELLNLRNAKAKRAVLEEQLYYLLQLADRVCL